MQGIGFAIGLINEFAFPVDILKEQIQSILINLGHQTDNIQLLDMDNITSIDSSKVNIISNISSTDDIESVGNKTDNKAMFIACGLEHDLASVSKQKIVKEFKTRIQRDTNNPKEFDYRNIGQNLATNEKLKKLRENINKCYHQADFFLTYESDKNSKLSKYKMKQQLKRFFNLLHGFPFATPTKDEYAMHMAFSSALRSSDLSRQVGAIITTSNGDILATGANDIPKSGGGLYRSHLNEENGSIYDDALGRDYMRGFDSNAIEKNLLIDNIYDALEDYVDVSKVEAIKLAIANSKLKDITEYGRVVHAEMDALMACARGHVSSDGAILYCTTFPCHNCAKHIIAAGIKRVVYIEPYAKSKALPFHFDSVVDEESNPIEELIKSKLPTQLQKKVSFESFVGVGPHLFRQLFKMRDGSRKDKNGLIKSWKPQLIDL
ncbi:MAG: dCMP deaminase family protein [Neisseriaceae bacterium]|nr:MAG: dCMP deaminase family protein [Neisseriaceae bacterium]